MTLSEYQAAITRTYAISDPHDLLKLALVGLVDELGEVAGPLKKYLWQGHDLDRAHLLEEVGDVLWYLATLCNALGLSLEDALTANLAKLQQRYPDGFSSERSRTRATPAVQDGTPSETEALVKRLMLSVWQASADALVLSYKPPCFSQEEVISLGEQVGHLLTFLARRNVVPIDATSPGTREAGGN